MISRFEIRMRDPEAAVVFLQIRFTMAATILTAVETAPRIIRIEIRGVMNAAPAPFCTMNRVGTL